MAKKPKEPAAAAASDAPADVSDLTAEVPADAGDVQDAARETSALDALDRLETVRAEESDRPKGGRPKGAKSRVPSKDEWRSRARKAEADVKRLEAEAAAAAAQGEAQAVAGGADMLRGGFDLLFRFAFSRIAANRGPHWLLTADEHEALVESWARALAPWAPSLGKVAPLGVALTVTVAIVRERAAKDAQGVQLGAVGSDAQDAEAAE